MPPTWLSARRKSAGLIRRGLEAPVESLMIAVALLSAAAFCAAFLWISLSRITYPYDLEWMEGGMLTHSLRLLEGKPLFAPPSVTFIPYIYQPLYAMVVAGVGLFTGLSLPVARGVSLASTLVVALLLFRTIQRETHDSSVAAIGVGLLFAEYPVVGFWYDLARVDSLFMALTFTGLYVARYHGEGTKRYGVPVVVATMVAAYFTKQTAVLFIPLAFPLLYRARPSRGVVYLVSTVAIIAGLTLIADHVTGGWYTYYVQRVVSAEPSNWTRIHKDFWVKAVRDIPLVLGAGGVWMVTRVAGRSVGAVARESWYPAALAGLVSGVLSYSWQGGFDNNFIPFYVFAIIPACEALAWAWRAAPAPWSLAGSLALMAQFFVLVYNPVKQVPTEEEIADGGRLVELLASTPGAVLIPEHPWYAVLAGKEPSYHSMALVDLRHEQRGMWPQDLRDRLQSHYYDLVVTSWDPRKPSLGSYPPELLKYYRKAKVLRFRGRAMGSYVGTWARPSFVFAPRKPPQGL